MDVKIYADLPEEQNILVARVDEEGKLYAIDGEKEEYIGWIDYQEGDVYDSEDFLLGWAEDDGSVLIYYEDEDEEEEIGYVTEEGEIFFYQGEDEEVFFGKLANMKSYADGAAALLFFLEEEEEEGEE
jgi:hypothetical protein